MCWDSGVKRLDPWGSHRYYIMFIQEGVHTRSRPHEPVSCRMTLILTTYCPAASPRGSNTSKASPGSNTSEGHIFSQIKAAEPPSPEARDAIGCPLTFDLSHEGWKEKNALLSVAVEAQAAAWLWSKGWYDSISSAWDLFLFLSLSFRLSLAISRCQGDVAGQQPKGNRIRHGKVKTECLAHLALPHTHTHSSRREPWARCCKSPEILLDFLFSFDSEPPDSSPRPLSVSDIAFLQPLVIKLGVAGCGVGGGGCLNVAGDHLAFPSLWIAGLGHRDSRSIVCSPGQALVAAHSQREELTSVFGVGWWSHLNVLWVFVVHWLYAVIIKISPLLMHLQCKHSAVFVPSLSTAVSCFFVQLSPT